MAVLRVADADERRQSAQNGVIGAVAKGQMAADKLSRRSRIAGADGQQELAMIACRLEHGFQRRCVHGRRVRQNVTLSVWHQCEIARRELDRFGIHNPDPAAPLHHMMEARHPAKVRHRRAPGRRKIGAEVEGAAKLDGLEDIGKHIHAGVSRQKRRATVRHSDREVRITSNACRRLLPKPRSNNAGTWPQFTANMPGLPIFVPPVRHKQSPLDRPSKVAIYRVARKPRRRRGRSALA